MLRPMRMGAPAAATTTEEEEEEEEDKEDEVESHSSHVCDFAAMSAMWEALAWCWCG